jgi:hypothetical protein
VVTVRVVIAVVPASGRIDDSGQVVISTTGVGNDDAVVVSAGRVDSEAAQRSRKHRTQHVTP